MTETAAAHDEIEKLVRFLRSAEQLKNTLRSAWTSAGERESVAEHTWRLSLMALVIAPLYPDVDFARLVKICIIHDLGEAIGGDIPAPHQVAGAGKAAAERRDLLELLAPLPARVADEITSLWDDYEAATSAEARLAKALDKLETIMQHNQGKNPSDFDYGFNLQYGRHYTSGDPLMARIRELLDEETSVRAGVSEGEPEAG